MLTVVTCMFFVAGVFCSALQTIPPEKRPHEIHLCAPAGMLRTRCLCVALIFLLVFLIVFLSVTEDELPNGSLEGLTRPEGTTYLYYTDKDWVLRWLFGAWHRKTAIGLIGTIQWNRVME